MNPILPTFSGKRERPPEEEDLTSPKSTTQSFSFSSPPPKPAFADSLNAFFDQVASPKSAQSFSSPAPPPVKRVTVSRQAPIRFRHNANILRDQIKKNQPLQLRFSPYTIVKLLGEGWEGSAYLIQDAEGNKKVLKLKNDKGNEATLSEIANQLEQYAQLRAKKLPVAKHENFEPFLGNEHFTQLCAIRDPDERHTKLIEFARRNIHSGYYLVEYVPQPFPKPRDDVPIDEKELAPWLQLKELFQKLYEHGVAADLRWENVGLTEQGELRYFDLHPLEEELPTVSLTVEESLAYLAAHPQEEEIKENPFTPLLNKYLEGFANRGTPLWDFLDPREKSISSSS